MHVDDAQEARLKLLVPFVLFTAALAVSASASAQSAGPGGNPGAASADHAAAQAKKLFRLANFLIHEHQPEAACTILRHDRAGRASGQRSEEHTSELQSLMRRSYAGFCLKKKTTNITKPISKYKKTR